MDKKDTRWWLLGFAIGLSLLLFRTHNYIIALLLGVDICFFGYLWQETTKQKYPTTTKAKSLFSFVIKNGEMVFVIGGLALSLLGIRASIETANSSNNTTSANSTGGEPVMDLQQIQYYIDWYIIAVYIFAGIMLGGIVLYVIERISSRSGANNTLNQDDNIKLDTSTKSNINVELKVDSADIAKMDDFQRIAMTSIVDKVSKMNKKDNED